MTQPALEEPKDGPETGTGIAEEGWSVELLQGKAPPDVFHGGQLLAGALGRPPPQQPLIGAIAQRDQAVVVIQAGHGTERSTSQKKVSTFFLAFSHAVERGLGHTCERAEVWDGHFLGQLSSSPTAWEMNSLQDCHHDMAFSGPASSVDHKSFRPRVIRFIDHRERML